MWEYASWWIQRPGRVYRGWGWPTTAWGSLTSFSFAYGRPAGQLHHSGATGTFVFEGGSAWTDYSDYDNSSELDRASTSDPLVRGDGLLLRWNPPGVTWAKGPPVVFAGTIRDVSVEYRPSADGQARVTATVSAEDYMASTAADYSLDLSALPSGAYPAVRDVCCLGETYPVVRIGTLPGTQISDDAELYNFDTVGQFIRAMCESLAVEIYMRHGERLIPDSTPTDAPDDGHFNVAPPEMVLRFVGGPSTFTADGILTYSGAQDQRAFDGSPIARIYRLGGRAASVRVSSPAILDHVSLTSAAADDDGEFYTAEASAAFPPAVAREEMARSGCIDRMNGADHYALDLAAERWLSSNTAANRHIEITLAHLADDEIDYWSRIGVADELELPGVYGLAKLYGDDTPDQPFRCQVASVEWHGQPGTATLILGAVQYGAPPPPPPPPPPEPVFLWSATLGVRSDDDSNDTGWSVVGQGDYGILTDHTVDTPAGEVLLDAIRWSPLSSTLWIWADTGQDAARLDGLWMQIGDDVSGLISQAVPPGGRQLRLNPAPSSVPWSDGDYLIVRVSDIDPAGPPASADQPLLTADMTVAASGTNRGYQTNSFGTITDNDFDHDGDTLIIDRLYERTTATNDMRLEFRTAAQAQAAEGLWLRCDPGVSYRLTAGDRTNNRFVWDQTPDPSWDSGDSVRVEVWAVEPAEDAG